MKSAAALFAHMTTAAAMTSRLSMRRLTCRVFGHRFANHNLTEVPERERMCSCGESLLRADGAVTHVRHNLACFLGGHSYTKIGERAGHCEYVCSDCGHPLMFEREASTYARQERFRKFVRHRCGWFGHVVHEVAERGGLTEYACHCGHSFLLQAKGLTRVRHPLLCVMTGHRIRLLARRNEQLEFRCRDCGHPFCLGDETGRFQSPSTPLSRRCFM
jgi:DNA-directed RNA polymerase subunit RPC12/RpoP